MGETVEGIGFPDLRGLFGVVIPVPNLFQTCSKPVPNLFHSIPVNNPPFPTVSYHSMNGYQIFELLPKKDNGLVSFSSVAKTYKLSIGRLNRALAEFDTGEGITSQALEHLISIGLITPKPLESDCEVLEGEMLDSQLSHFEGRNLTLPSPRPSTALSVSAEGYSLNGKLQALLALQSENQGLKSDIETLRENQARAMKAWEEMTLLEAELTAQNYVLRKQRILEEMESKGLNAQLEVMGIMGKSLG